MAKPTAEKVIKFAKSFVRNAPYKPPNRFTRWFGFGEKSVPYCAIFVYYCIAKAGGKELMSGCSNKAYCPTIYNWGKNKGYLFPRTVKAKQGDLALFDWQKDGVCDHIGFVISDMGGGYVRTVEGNTSNVNNSNGGCVQIRQRRKSDIKGFVRLPYSKNLAKAKPPKGNISTDEVPKPKPNVKTKYRKIDRVYRVLPSSGLNVRKSPGGTVLKALPQNAEIRCTLSDRKGWLYCPAHKGWVCFSNSAGKYLKWIR